MTAGIITASRWRFIAVSELFVRPETVPRVPLEELAAQNRRTMREEMKARSDASSEVYQATPVRPSAEVVAEANAEHLAEPTPPPTPPTDPPQTPGEARG